MRYQLTVDTDVVDGKRKQLRRRYRTEKEARAALAEIQGPSQIALVAAWLGHADVSFTMRTYVYAQPEALSIEARSFAPPLVESGD